MTCSAIFIDQRIRFREYFVEILSGLAISQELKLQNGAQLIVARKLINNLDFLRVSTTKCALTRRGIVFSSGSYRRQARRAECKTSLARPQFIATPLHCNRFLCAHSGHPAAVRGNELRTEYTKKRLGICGCHTLLHKYWSQDCLSSESYLPLRHMEFLFPLWYAAHLGTGSEHQVVNGRPYLCLLYANLFSPVPSRNE